MNRRAAHRGFSMVELVLVATILGIVAVSVIPSLESLDQTERALANREVERYLIRARGYSMSTGEPAGVRFDIAEQTVELVRIAFGESDISSMLDPLGQEYNTDARQAVFRATEIDSIVHGNGGAGSGTIWFSQDGTPQVRNEEGSLIGSFSRDAVITLDGDTITVRRLTGVIE